MYNQPLPWLEKGFIILVFVKLYGLGLRGDFVESLNILFQKLVDPHDSVEDIANEYLVDEELKLCLEEEERIRSEHEKRIQQEKRLRLEEDKMLQLEEEKMFQIAEVKKRKRYEFMNSTYVKTILGNFPPINIPFCIHIKLNILWSIYPCNILEFGKY
ncbi:hypothetical protein Tco_1196491 [Tanacetum coccineum]